MKKKIIYLLLIFICLSCKSQSRSNNLIKLEVIISGFGKTNYDVKMLEKVTGISSNNFTSNLYIINTNDFNAVNGFAVNDLLFNYDYFYKNIYNNLKNRKVDIFLRKYNNLGKEVKIIEKIE